jgi:hypothetical protein
MGPIGVVFPPDSRFVPGDRVPARFSDEADNDFRYLLQHEHEEPLGHSLLREAWEQREENPRSALVVGVAAAEVGFKHSVAELAPHAAWLMEEIPSPPLQKMMSTYLPLLLEGRDEILVKRLPKSIIKLVDEANQKRNIVVHKSPTGQRRYRELHAWFDQSSLDSVLLAVCDLLWLLDYYRGYPWALDYVRGETLEDWRSLGP